MAQRQREIIEMDQHRKAVNTETDDLRAKRNTLSKEIGPLMREGKLDEAEPLKAEVKAGGERLAELTPHARSLRLRDAPAHSRGCEEALFTARPPRLADRHAPAPRGGGGARLQAAR